VILVGGEQLRGREKINYQFSCEVGSKKSLCRLLGI